MGAGWRRFTERFRSHGAYSSGKVLIQPTSNQRCKAALNETGQFTNQMTKLIKALRAMKASNDAMLVCTKEVMTSPLPFTYEQTALGTGGELARITEMIGGSSFQHDIITETNLSSGQKLEVDVLAPMQRWLDVRQTLVARYKAVEAMRLELDSRRRTVADLTAKMDEYRCRMTQGPDARLEAKMTAAAQTLQHKEVKAQVAAQAYEQAESALFEDLATLIRDARWVKNYVAVALRLQGNQLLQASQAFGPVPVAATNSLPRTPVSTTTTTTLAEAMPASAGITPVKEQPAVGLPPATDTDIPSTPIPAAKAGVLPPNTSSIGMVKQPINEVPMKPTSNDMPSTPVRNSDMAAAKPVAAGGDAYPAI